MRLILENNTWLIYEQEKQKIVMENLTPEEYTKRIQELCDKLGI